ncbi:Bud-site selection protein [Kalaharituber pfeilii]|nr:Bud-site selection protein [Kalaharituber pfeilii]
MPYGNTNTLDLYADPTPFQLLNSPSVPGLVYLDAPQMPKRKTPTTTTHLPYRRIKHPRLSSNDLPDDPDAESGDAVPRDILSVDPSTLPPRAICGQQQIVEQKVHYTKRLVARALKTGKGFERQRIGKKLKAAREGKGGGGGEGTVRKLEVELEILKELDLSELASAHVLKAVNKQKQISMSPFFPPSCKLASTKSDANGAMKEDGKEKEEEEKDKAPRATARNNVIAMLYNTNPVKEAMKQVLEMIRELVVPGDGAGKTKREDKGEGGRGGEEEGKEKNNGSGESDEEEEEDGSETEASEWNGIKDDDTGGENDISSEEEKATKKAPGKLSIRTIDPSRGTDDEWSGEEDEGDFDISDEEEEEGKGNDEEDAEEEEEDKEVGEDVDLSEAEILKKLDKFIAPGSDEEDGDDNKDGSSAESDSESETPKLPLKTKKPEGKEKSKTEPSSTSKPKLKSKSKSKSKSPSPSPSPAPPSLSKTASTKTANAFRRPTTSTFLPTLMTGYISGSDSDDHGYSKLSKNKQSERKNRMGQQARRALAEKKFGEKARHIKTRDTGEMGRGRGPGGDKSRGGDGIWGDKGWDRGGVGRGRGDGGVERKRDNDKLNGPLHPSWEAKRKEKEAKASLKFEGKRVKFE